MRISHQYKFVYLAVPRTGSTSVRDALDPISDIKSVHRPLTTEEHPYYHHIPYAELEPLFKKNGWDIGQYYSFGVVRNPFDRVVSLYHHYREKGGRWAEGKSVVYNLARAAKLRLLPNDSFEKFVDKLDTTTAMQMSASSFFSDKSGEFSVNTVLKFERVAADYAALAVHRGFPEEQQQLQKLNQSRNRLDYRSYYVNPRLVDHVAELYADDISRFDYAFEPIEKG